MLDRLLLCITRALRPVPVTVAARRPAAAARPSFQEGR